MNKNPMNPHMKELAPKAAPATTRKFDKFVLALFLCFALEALDGAVMFSGLRLEDRLTGAMISIGMLLFVTLATYGVHHRTKWGAPVAIGIACITIGFNVPTLLIGKLTINGVPIDEPLISQAIGWAKVAAYAFFLFLAVRERFRSYVRQQS
jgi:hypothetical protein